MSPPGPGARDCTAHGRISEELRGVAELLAARLQPWLERMAQNDDHPGQSPGPDGAPCTWCPICALITALRGDQPDALARLAEHGAGMVAAVRELLIPPAGHSPAGEPAAAPGDPPPPGRSVQHIVVRPAGGSGGSGGC